MRFSLPAVSVAVAATATTLAVLPSGADAVNFVVIQADDMPYFDDWDPPAYLSSQWNRRGNAHTEPYPNDYALPNINKLRENGLHMTNAYAAAPKCGTSRFSTVTGRYPSRSALSRKKAISEGLTGGLPSDVTIPKTKLDDETAMADGLDCSHSNLAQLFQANGYTTGMVGKWHLTKVGSNDVASIVDSINECGFMDVEAMYPDNLDGFEGWAANVDHNLEYVAYKSVEFIEDNKETDWFLYVNPTAPHSPSISDALDKDCRITVDGDFTSTMTTGWSVDGMTKDFEDDCFAYRADLRERAGNSTDNTDLGSVWVDDMVGAIYKGLENSGQLDETMILFQLDHGRIEKDRVWEGGVKIAQFIHYPDGWGTNGTTFDGLVSTIDIGPTMVDLAGIDSTNAKNNSWYEMDGKSWIDAVFDSATGADWVANRCLFFEGNKDRSVRCGCDKYILFDSASDDLTNAINNDFEGYDAATTESLVNLCDADGNYLTADSGEYGPEGFNIIDQDADTAVKASEMASLLSCHLTRTDADEEPLYQECSVEFTEFTPSPTVTSAPSTPVAWGKDPELVDSTPWQNDILSPNSDQAIRAIVLEDDLERVRFRVQEPDATSTSSEQGTLISSSGHEYTYGVTTDTTNSMGVYGYRVMIDTNDGNTTTLPGDDDWYQFLVAESASDVLTAARSEIKSIINEFGQGMALASKFVRLGFHDCVGGCDGCVDMTDGDNGGLDVPIEALEPIVDMFSHYGVTRADIWVLAALQGAYGNQEDGSADNRNFAMNWYGRPNCEDLNEASNCVDGLCTQDRGPVRHLPSADLDTAGLLEYFATEFGFDERDTVAIMGAHTLGTLSQENSGYNGPNGWLGDSRTMNNEYYNDLIGGDNVTTDDLETIIHATNWEVQFVNNSAFDTPDRYEWERGDDPHFVMVNADMAIVRDLTDYIDEDGNVEGCLFRCKRNNGDGCTLPRCPYAADTIYIAQEYKHNNAVFLEDFESAFLDMLEHGDYDTVNTVCTSAPCQVGEEARRNLRGQ